MTSANKTLEGCANLYPAIVFQPFLAHCRLEVMAQCLVKDGPLGWEAG